MTYANTLKQMAQAKDEALNIVRYINNFKEDLRNEIINKYPDVLDSNNHICPLCGAPLIEVEDLLGNDWACKNYSDGTCNYRRDSVWMPPRKS